MVKSHPVHGSVEKSMAAGSSTAYPSDDDEPPSVYEAWSSVDGCRGVEKSMAAGSSDGCRGVEKSRRCTYPSDDRGRGGQLLPPPIVVKLGWDRSEYDSAGWKRSLPVPQSVEEPRVDDWTCPECGNQNYGFRRTCNFRHCPSMTYKPGDWTCPSCGNHNYASRDTCGGRSTRIGVCGVRRAAV